MVAVVVVVLVVTLGGGRGAEAAFGEWVEACKEKNVTVIYDMTPNERKENISQGEYLELIRDLPLGDMSHIKVMKVEESGDCHGCNRKY